MERINNRGLDQLRSVKITRDYTMHSAGSVLIEMGNTKVICCASVEEKVPHFLKGTNSGWVTAEYSMLPSSTHSRKIRASSKGKVDGRTQEIQRLIGRSIRSIIDLGKLGERTIWLDCDVIQADGGTRTASITGAFVAMAIALQKLIEEGKLDEMPINSHVAAVSVGIVGDTPVLDLCYEEDSTAKVDMNVVMTEKLEIIEVQGTGEECPFTRNELNQLLDLAECGIRELVKKQIEIIGEVI